MAVEGTWEGLFMFHRWIVVLVAFCLTGDQDGNGPGGIGSWIRAELSFELLCHVVNGLAGGAGLERFGSTGVASFSD